MKTPILLFLSLVCVTSQAQTKIIAHKSHSGSNTNFSAAFANDLFDMEEDNLGMAPNRYEIKKEHAHPQLDSVIFVSNEKSIIVTSNYCTMENVYDKGDTKKKVWRPGKEIAYKHPLFSNQHSLDSIKKVLNNSYGFENPIDQVVFVGYDNTKEIPVIQKSDVPIVNEKIIQKEAKRKSRNGVDKSILVVLGFTLATFFSGLFMLNRNN